MTTSEIIESEAFSYWRRFLQESESRTIAVIDITEQPNGFEVGGYGPGRVVRLSTMDIPSRQVSTILFEVERLAEV